MSRTGPHIDPPLASIPEILRSHGWSTFQTILRNPQRLAREGVPDEEDQSAFRAGIASIVGCWGMVHASLLTSLGSPDPRIRNGSASALVADAGLAATLGLAGVCFHVGYEKGHPSRDAALDAVAYKLRAVLSRLEPPARVLLENGAEGTELGQTVDELATVVRAVEGDPASLGIVLDTCHLHVTGFDLAAAGAPERLAVQLEGNGLVPFLTALHLNDAAAPCGSRRDRHAIPGKGTIGEGLLRLREHALFRGLPAVLEMSVDAAAEGIAFLEALD